MKKMGIALMLVLCLAMQGFSSKGIVIFPSKQEAERIRKDTAKMREYIEGYLLCWLDGENIIEFKQLFELSDEAMQTMLMEIIRESSAIAGWTQHNPGGSNERTIDFANAYLREAIAWLGFCANTEGKKFLMDIITDGEKNNSYRSRAIGSYLYRANAQETQDALTRFFADDIKDVITPFSLYYTAMGAYDNAENDPQKRKAIIAELSKENNKKTFDEMDKRLAERNKRYAESPQRKATLERMKPPKKETP